MKSLIKFFKELFDRRPDYIDLGKVKQLQEKGITPLF